MGAQREICEQIIDQGGEYLISLKGNQGALHKDVIEYFKDEELRDECDSFVEYDKGHGRIEERRAFVTQEINWLQQLHNWPGLKSIGMVISNIQKKDKISKEIRYYISSLE